MPPKVSYMGVKVWPADKGEKKKRWDPSSFSLLVVSPNPHLFFATAHQKKGPPLFFSPLFVVRLVMIQTITLFTL